MGTGRSQSLFKSLVVSIRSESCWGLWYRRSGLKNLVKRETYTFQCKFKTTSRYDLSGKKKKCQRGGLLPLPGERIFVQLSGEQYWSSRGLIDLQLDRSSREESVPEIFGSYGFSIGLPWKFNCPHRCCVICKKCSGSWAFGGGWWRVMVICWKKSKFFFFWSGMVAWFDVY